MVGEQSRTAGERRKAIEQNVTLAEERLSQLVGALRELATRLENTLERRPASAPEAHSAPSAGDGEPMGDAATRRPGSRRKPAKPQAEAK